MWAVDNRTPFAAQGSFLRDRHGVEHWVVAVRACFSLRADGLLDVAPEPPPVRLVGEYVDGQAREMKAAADIAPFRPAADILVRGIACAPGEAVRRTCAVRVRVGAIEKRARVSGRRVLRRTGGRRGRLTLDGPEDFAGVRLVWRAALGGVDPFAEPGAPPPRRTRTTPSGEAGRRDGPTCPKAPNWRCR